MKTSAIAWTDYSGGDLNFVTGCTPVSEGCKNCYARAIYKRFKRDFSKVTVHEEKLQRLTRKRFPQFSPKRGEPNRPMCFVVDTGDLFHKEVPWWFRRKALQMMIERQDIIWQLLTKRPELVKLHIEDILSKPWNHWRDIKRLPPHVWLGASVSNQRTADERIPILLDTPAAVRFVSVEPMLEAMDLFSADGEIAVRMKNTLCYPADLIDWVIVGAESGPNRRPFDVAWAVAIKRQCDASGVAFFGKQDSGRWAGVPLLIDGRTWQDWPEDRE